MGPLARLLPQPRHPKGSLLVIECAGWDFSDGLDKNDKLQDGHRVETIPLMNEIIRQGWEAQHVFYSDASSAVVGAAVREADGYIVRVDPGWYPGVSWNAFNALLDRYSDETAAHISPRDREILGGKSVLYELRDTEFGMPDTEKYYTKEEVFAGLAKSLAQSDRVLKQHGGSCGSGVYVLKVPDRTKLKDGQVTAKTKLEIWEAFVNQKATLTLNAFVEAFAQRHFVKLSCGYAINQRFMANVTVTGELRITMVGLEAVKLQHKLPRSGIACNSSHSVWTDFDVNDSKYDWLVKRWRAALPEIL